MKSCRPISVLLMFVLLSFATVSHAGIADPWVGTWVRKSITGAPPDKGEYTMTIENWGKSGYRLTYRLAGVAGVTVVESDFEGADAPVLIAGKPTGQTIAIKRLDDHHTSAVLKVNGKQFMTSKSTLSADSKTLTIEDEATVDAGGMPPGKQTEVWIRK